MARNLEAYKLAAKIEVDGAKALSTLRAVDRQATQTQGSLANVGKGATAALSGIGTALSVAGGNLISGVLSKLASGMTEVTQQGVAYNRQIEMSTVALTQLTGSADAATKHLAELEKMAVKTPFELQDLTAASLKLQAFGMNAQEVTRYLPAISDAASIAAAGTGDFKGALDGVILSLGQMRAKGKVSLEEINQLTERGVPALDILAKKIGKTTAETTKLIESGRARGDVGARLLLEGFQERYAGLGDRLSNTLAGKESNATDILRKQAGQAAVETTEAYKRALDEVISGAQTQTVNTLAKEYDKRFAADASLLTDIVTGNVSAKEIGAQLVPTIKDTATELSDILKKGIGAAWTGAGNFLSGVAAGVGQQMGQSAEKGTKDSLQIKSPSRVFIGIGEQVAEGYAIGIENGLGRVESAMNAMLNAGLRGSVNIRRQQAESLANDPRIRAFLDTISKAEGANYDTLFGGGKFADFGAHPNQRITRMLGGKPLTSTAAGRYQFLSRTWQGLVSSLGLTDFSPRSQDLGAIELLRQRGVLDNILNGDIAGALAGANREWASLPGSPYGQPTKRAADLVRFYSSRLGAANGGSAGVMPPAVSAAAMSKPVPVMLVDTKGVNAGTIRASKDLLGYSDVKPEQLGRLAQQGTTAIERTAETGKVTADSVEKGLVQTGEKVAAAIETAGQNVANAAGGTGLFSKTPQQNYDELMGTADKKKDPIFLNPDETIAPAQGQVASAANYAKAGLGEVKNAAKDLGRSGFDMLASGIGGIVQDFVLLGETGPAAMRKLTASVLASLSAQAAVKSVFYLAEGFANLIFNPPAAAGYFTASALMAGIAVGTGLAGRALAGKNKNALTDEQKRQYAIKEGTSEGNSSNRFERRAMGGPVRKGRAYIVGEYRQEVFEPETDGRIYPSVDAYMQQGGYIGSNRRRGAGSNFRAIQQFANEHRGGFIGALLQKLLREMEVSNTHLSKLQPVNGDDMFIRYAHRNARTIAKATITGLDNDSQLASRLGQRIN